MREGNYLMAESFIFYFFQQQQAIYKNYIRFRK